MAEDKREPTRALDKASRVMDALAAENGLSPADIADACDIPRSSVYRVLDGLVDVGWTVTDTDGNYSLSLDWLRLADAARTSRTEWQPAIAVMHAITAQTGMTSFLSVVSGTELVCVECAQGHAIDSLILRPGACCLCMLARPAAWPWRISRMPMPNIILQERRSRHITRTHWSVWNSCARIFA